MPVLALSVATACSGGSGEDLKASEASQAPGNAGKQEAPIEISWLSFNFPQEDGTIVQKYLENKFNVKIKNIRIDRANWKDQLNVRLASGELPDLWLLWGVSDVNAYASQNLLAELPVEEIKAQIPDLGKLVDDKEPGAWVDGMINGKNYGIPITNLDGAYPLLNTYNENWLKKIGYDSPPVTLEQLEDVLYKFRNDDPDGNGKKDTYGLTGKAAYSVGESFPGIFGAFDVQPDYWRKTGDGRVEYGITTEDARAAFRLLNKWFKDGVLDPEFITADGKKQEFENGRVGMTQYSWPYIKPSAREYQKQTNSSYFPLVTGKQPAAPGHVGHSRAWGLTGNYLGMGIDVEKTPGKKKKLYEMINAMYSDEEVIKYVSSGEEGVHYDMVEGIPVTKPEFKSKLQNLGIGAFYGLLSSKSLAFEPLRNPPEDLEWRAAVTKDIPMQADQVKFNLPSRTRFPDLANLEREYFIKFITGEVNLDAGFGEFVERWKKAGGQVLTEEANSILANIAR
jgi:putative aldouronate transport system substrate-binding protein